MAEVDRSYPGAEKSQTWGTCIPSFINRVIPTKPAWRDLLAESVFISLTGYPESDSRSLHYASARLAKDASRKELRTLRSG